MLTKDRIKKTIDSLPDTFTLDEVIEEIVLLNKIEQGMKDLKEGKSFTTKEVRKKLNV